MTLPANHPDLAILLEIANALTHAAGDPARLEQLVGEILRECVDKVIQTPKTGRRLYEELQNTEKTHIGTCVEIDLRSELGFRKGATQDLEVAGHDVDVKFTGRSAWMIPPEAIGHVCILISANEDEAVFTMGLVVAKIEYLTAGANRDAKKTISSAGRSNIHWIFEDAPYQKNFWLTVSQEVADKISAGRSGNERMMTLFREVLDRPISRKVVEDVAGQLDPTRRVRADRSRGTRNQLVADNILVLSGAKARDQELIARLALPEVNRTEYLAHRLHGEEMDVARSLGFDV